MKRVHFIAIGGAAMHNLARALHDKGFAVSGSDDEIKEPSYSRLEEKGLLPDKIGWRPELINHDLDAVIIGMHARSDNPELLRAQELGLNIYSFPEYIYEQSKDKMRVVVGGSHGKTSITAMILHVLNGLGQDFDYMVGSRLEGFENMVKLSDSADVIILEGDEYLSSPVDRRPKFLLYKAHIGLISGISWDHVNVFPTFEEYLDQFRKFIESIEKGGTLIYFAPDSNVKDLAGSCHEDLKCIPYTQQTGTIREGITYVSTKNGDVPLRIFGDHNLQNMEGARIVCTQLGVSDEQFYKLIASFGGAARRLEKVYEKDGHTIFRDFAHSPSKLKATIQAVKEQYPAKEVVACMELHTFSSLQQEFLKEYAGTMNMADRAIVYFNPETLKNKRLPALNTELIRMSFDHRSLTVFDDPKDLQHFLDELPRDNTVLLLMSSGSFDGISYSPKIRHSNS
jgi:UDP-N-acetylmuramate: L-alanyl-gamma-D-glutamyl-meso-diaminopimelate ligase